MRRYLEYVLDVLLPTFATVTWYRLLDFLAVVGTWRYDGLSSGAMQFGIAKPQRWLVFLLTWAARSDLTTCCVCAGVLWFGPMLVLRFVGGTQHPWRARFVFASLWFIITLAFCAMYGDYISCIIVSRPD